MPLLRLFIQVYLCGSPQNSAIRTILPVYKLTRKCCLQQSVTANDNGNTPTHRNLDTLMTLLESRDEQFDCGRAITAYKCGFRCCFELNVLSMEKFIVGRWHRNHWYSLKRSSLGSTIFIAMLSNLNTDMYDLWEWQRLKWKTIRCCFLKISDIEFRFVRVIL